MNLNFFGIMVKWDCCFLFGFGLVVKWYVVFELSKYLEEGGFLGYRWRGDGLYNSEWRVGWFRLCGGYNCFLESVFSMINSFVDKIGYRL